MTSGINNKARRCDTCKTLLDNTKSKTVCACKRFKFCDNVCYSSRPMRSWHREECDQKAAERKAKEVDRKKAAISLKRSEAVQNQPRATNGQFGKTKLDLDEKAAKNRLNTATSNCVKNIREAGQALQKVRKKWQMRFVVIRDEKGCKTDPVVFETKNFNGKRLRDEVIDTPEMDSENLREIDLSYEETHEDDVKRTPTYRCYICQKITGPKKGFVCAEQDENQPCLNGAACVSCINLDMKRLSTSERKVFRNNWRCPIHKSTSGGTGHVQEDLQDSEELPKKKKRPVGRRMKLLSISDALKQIMPEDKEHYTRTEIHKGVHQYINDRPQLKVVDPQTNARLVHPDEALAAVYGSEPFKGFSKVPQLKSHVKETGLYFEPSQSMDEMPASMGEGTSGENVAGTSETAQTASSPVLRRGPSTDTSMSSPDDCPDSDSSVTRRQPKKFINHNNNRKGVFQAPPRVPPPPKGQQDSLPAIAPEEVNSTVRSFPCSTCEFPLFNETPEMRKEPIKNKKVVIRCPGCRSLIHKSCYLGLNGCKTCSQKSLV